VTVSIKDNSKVGYRKETIPHALDRFIVVSFLLNTRENYADLKVKDNKHIQIQNSGCLNIGSKYSFV
jgi:hypothetical protein